MELKEVSASSISPYRCYVRGNIIQTEGENVQTIGFKDGIAVLQMIPPSTDMQNSTDNAFDSKAIDLTKLKKIIVKIDPKTGKKYIFKDGKRIEILPQITNPIISLKPGESATISKTTTTQTVPPEERIKRNIIIKSPFNLVNMNGGQYPKLVPASTITPKLVPAATINNMKTIQNVKYHVLSMNMKNANGRPLTVTSSTMTDSEFVDKSAQTDSGVRREACTQTEPPDGGESHFSDMFIDFILGTDGDSDSVASRRMIDPSKLKTKEEIHKFNFFNDMRNALNFDRSGNLPIHDSVMQNNLKQVQKNCVVLKAVKESVNILNQHSYAPIHLAVSHNVDVEILKVLLHHDADLQVADPEGNTAIHLAVEHRRPAMLKLLVNGAVQSKVGLDAFNYEGFTPLILACLNHSYPDAKLLLQSGADPNVKDMKSGRTALFHAAEGHDVDLVELLMQYRADTKIRNFFGTSPHDAMFELDDVPLKIKFCILGRDHQRFQNKRKVEHKESSIKKAKLETTPVLRKVSSDDMIPKRFRK